MQNCSKLQHTTTNTYSKAKQNSHDFQKDSDIIPTALANPRKRLEPTVKRDICDSRTWLI